MMGQYTIFQNSLSLAFWIYVTSIVCVTSEPTCRFGYDAPTNGTYTKTDLHHHLFQCGGYTKEVWDHNHSNEEVGVTTSIKRIINVDSTKQTVKLKIGLLIRWSDNRLRWDSVIYSNAKYITKEVEDIWVPPLVLASIQRTGWEHMRVEINSAGRHIFGIELVLTVPCTFDLNKFPFDTQSCRLNFHDNTHFEHMLLYNCTDETDSTPDYYVMNTEWNLLKTVCIDTRPKSLSLELNIKRRPKFYILNLIIPIMCLSLMNSFVFLLPYDNGGRVGLCVTLFLSWTVYITYIIGIVPKGSDQMPCLSVIVVLQKIIMVVSLLINILVVRFNRQDHPGLRIFKLCACGQCPKFTGPCESEVVEKGTQLEKLADTHSNDGPLDGEPDNERDRQKTMCIQLKKKINNIIFYVCFSMTIFLYIVYFLIVSS